jgi:hypothetical protein
MIKYIMGSDSSVIDASTMNSGSCYTSGAMYWDANQQQVKVIDSNGNSATLTAGSANINVGPKLREMLVWFEQKKFEEQQIAELCKQYPNLAEAKKEFDALYNIVKEHK